MIRNATISQCGQYRYDLIRAINGKTPTNTLLGVCMLNPSTADADVDDPTIKRLIALAERHRFGGIYVVNCFAFRATDPKMLKVATDPVGVHNFAFLSNAAMQCERILVGWGALAKFPDPKHQELVAATLKRFGARLLCLSKNKDGSPVHPLYQPADAALMPWSLPK